MTSFAEVLESAQSGDAGAFGVLWRETQPILLRYLRTLTTEGEDVASETWLQVVRGLSRFRGGEAAFRAWVCTIGRCRAVDAMRAGSRRPEIPVSELPEPLTGATAPDAAAEAMEHWSTDRAIQLIASLPSEQAEAVMLRVVAGLDVASVAKITGRSAGAVRVAAHRGLRRLAAQLEPASAVTL
ncbi:MAG TPA: RNA polymerase sigma factor [Mycobacteriales bacterium]|nr:RNA polymerase sigma factor [Mycobacteriales bacterium]